MKTWQRRTIGVLTLGGSGAGFTIVLGEIFNTTLATSTLIIFSIVLVLYALGIVAGVLVLENHRHALKAALPFWVIQVPVVTTPLLTFQISSGARFNILFAEGANLNFTWGAGSQFSFYLFTDTPFAIGVNIVAISVIWALIKHHASPPNDASH